MAQTNVHEGLPQNEPNGEIRESLATIHRERSRKLVFVIASIVVLLLVAAYLTYASTPGTMKLDTSGQQGRGAK